MSRPLPRLYVRYQCGHCCHCCEVPKKADAGWYLSAAPLMPCPDCRAADDARDSEPLLIEGNKACLPLTYSERRFRERNGQPVW